MYYHQSFWRNMHSISKWILTAYPRKSDYQAIDRTWPEALKVPGELLGERKWYLHRTLHHRAHHLFQFLISTDCSAMYPTCLHFSISPWSSQSQVIDLHCPLHASYDYWTLHAALLAMLIIERTVTVIRRRREKRWDRLDSAARKQKKYRNFLLFHDYKRKYLQSSLYFVVVSTLKSQCILISALRSCRECFCWFWTFWAARYSCISRPKLRREICRSSVNNGWSFYTLSLHSSLSWITTNDSFSLKRGL